MTDDEFRMEVKIPHTEPKTPVIVALQLGTHKMIKARARRGGVVDDFLAVCGGTACI